MFASTNVASVDEFDGAWQQCPLGDIKATPGVVLSLEGEASIEERRTLTHGVGRAPIRWRPLFRRYCTWDRELLL